VVTSPLTLIDGMGDNDTIYAGIFSFDDIKDHSPSRELTGTELEKVFNHAIESNQTMQFLFSEVVQDFGFSVAKSLTHFNLDDGWQYQGLTGGEQVTEREKVA
jgi:hypothetical protein